jgi:hypothetical protein
MSGNGSRERPLRTCRTARLPRRHCAAPLGATRTGGVGTPAQMPALSDPQLVIRGDQLRSGCPTQPGAHHPRPARCSATRQSALPIGRSALFSPSGVVLSSVVVSADLPREATPSLFQHCRYATKSTNRCAAEGPLPSSGIPCAADQAIVSLSAVLAPSGPATWLLRASARLSRRKPPCTGKAVLEIENPNLLWLYGDPNPAREGFAG